MRELLCCCLMALLPVSALAQKVVVAGGEITEIVYALGAQDVLVGVDATSNYPPQANALPKVGYVRALPVEGVMSLQPDIILLSGEAGPPQAISQLEGLAQVETIDIHWSCEGLQRRIRSVATLLSKTGEGNALAARISARCEGIADQLPLSSAPRTMIVLSAGRRGTQVAGKHTQGQALLDALAFPNVAENEGFKPLNAEAAIALDPELIIVAETVPGSFNLEEWPLLGTTTAVKQGRLLVDDAMFLLGFGPRLPDAMQAVLNTARNIND